jgi:tetratricopeptide (TPR) repeat protein
MKCSFVLLPEGGSHTPGGSHTIAVVFLMSLWLPPSGGRPAAALHAQGPTDNDIAKLEQALTSRPDDLRAGNDYRMAIIKAGQYDRGLDLFKQLVTSHPSAANAHLNYGFQYVDKIPAAGSITQVILANNALTQFSKSLELKPTWIGYYTRGNSYLYWPRIFGRTKLGIADLEEALKIQKAEPKRSYHVRVYVALGDGYFKMDDLAKATSVWKDGLAQFPDGQALKQRLSLQPDGVQALLDTVYDPNKRVDTNLQELWSDK